MDETQYRLPPSYEPVPPPAPWWKRFTGPLVAALAIGLKFLGSIKAFILPALKFLPALLKSGGSMLFMIWLYAGFYGWPFAVGFVVLILIHECGHLVAARFCGIKAGLPVFLPFMGAYVALKDLPPNAWISAVVAIGGPIAGTVGALACHNVFIQTQDHFWLALASVGYFLNLLNLIPVGILDGGRIVNAISPWLLLPGMALLVWFMLEFGSNIILVLILLLSLPQVWKLFWSKTPEEEIFYRLSVPRRLLAGVCYFGLAAFLFYQYQSSVEELKGLGLTL